MVRSWIQLSLGLAICLLSSTVTADTTCEDLPDLKKDLSGWDLSSQEHDAIVALLDQAGALCAQGKDQQADQLVKEADNERINDWQQERMNTGH